MSPTPSGWSWRVLGTAGALAGSGCFGNAVYSNVDVLPVSEGSAAGGTSRGDASEAPGGEEGDEGVAESTGLATNGSSQSTGGSTGDSTWMTGSTSSTSGAPVDTGTDTGDACASSERRMTIFVTPQTFPGDLSLPGWNWGDGMSGRQRGDILCDCVARNKGLKGQYKAWLSTGVRSIRTVLEDNDGTANFDAHPTAFVSEDGRCIAESWERLVSGDLLQPIGEPGVRVWTGSWADGSQAGAMCYGWESAWPGHSGVHGVAGASNGEWTDYPCEGACASRWCTNFYHLYCIQVDDTGQAPDPEHECPDFGGIVHDDP